jgi:hypothetical protein
MSRNFAGVRCWYCGLPAESRDHEPAKSKHKGIKLRGSCHKCNSAKGQLTAEEFREKLKNCHARKANWEFRVWPCVERIAPWNFRFFGELGNRDADWPPKQQKQMKDIRWNKPRSERGEIEKRIERVSIVGPFAEVQGGLMNGK